MWYFFGKFLYLTIFNKKSGNAGGALGRQWGGGVSGRDENRDDGMNGGWRLVLYILFVKVYGPYFQLC